MVFVHPSIILVDTTGRKCQDRLVYCVSTRPQRHKIRTKLQRGEEPSCTRAPDPKSSWRHLLLSFHGKVGLRRFQQLDGR